MILSKKTIRLYWNVRLAERHNQESVGIHSAKKYRRINETIEVIQKKKKKLNWKMTYLDILAFDNKLLIKNFSRTTPVDYQCIADNGIPPRDTRTKRLFSSSN